MALKLHEVSETSATGTLDGAYDFELTKTDDGLVARISSWTHTLAARSLDRLDAGGMRTYAYEALARFREDKNALSLRSAA
jgi:hypothetical protein